MSSKEPAPDKVHSTESPAYDAIQVTWVVRKGSSGVSSLPMNDIRAVWRNEVGDAQCTPARTSL